MDLPQHDEDADAREHSVDHGRRDGQRRTRHLQRAERHLHEPRRGHRRARHGEAQLLDEAKDHHREARRGAAHEQRHATQQAHHDAAHDARDEPRHDGRSEASAMPIQRGRATRNTTSEAGKSEARIAFNEGLASAAFPPEVIA